MMFAHIAHQVLVHMSRVLVMKGMLGRAIKKISFKGSQEAILCQGPDIFIFFWEGSDQVILFAELGNHPASSDLWILVIPLSVTLLHSTFFEEFCRLGTFSLYLF